MKNLFRNLFKKKFYSNKQMDHKHSTDAGWDIFIPQAVTIPPQGFVSINTGLKVAIPKGYVGLIFPRSSVSKSGIHVCTGVIDAGFAGEVYIFVKNLTKKHYHAEQYSRLAQMVILPCLLPEHVLCMDDKEILEHNKKISDREEKGYGSTGV